MNTNKWLSDYFAQYEASLARPETSAQLAQLKDLITETQAAGKKVLVAGNGGSAAMSSHVSVDLTKTAGVRAVNFNEADLITCFANDYGYEHWVEKAIEFYADPGDLVILISSSGKSPNMLLAADQARQQGLRLVTFTGFKADNLLRTKGQLNFWVDSMNYNIVENTHLIWLLAVCDLIVAEGQGEPRQEPAYAVRP